LFCFAVLWLPLKAQGDETPIQASGNPMPTNGPYLSIGLGALKPEDVSKGSLETSFDLGPLTEAAVGYRFGDFRTDISYSYTKNTVDRVSAQIMGATRDLPSNGSMQTNSGFLNLYYEVPTRKRFRPCLGGGVGYSRVDYSINGWFPLMGSPRPVPIATLLIRSDTREKLECLIRFQAQSIYLQKRFIAALR
jgi:opacity protein-like surface antigen